MTTEQQQQKFGMCPNGIVNWDADSGDIGFFGVQIKDGMVGWAVVAQEIATGADEMNVRRMDCAN